MGKTRSRRQVFSPKRGESKSESKHEIRSAVIPMIEADDFVESSAIEVVLDYPALFDDSHIAVESPSKTVSATSTISSSPSKSESSTSSLDHTPLSVTQGRFLVDEEAPSRRCGPFFRVGPAKNKSSSKVIPVTPKQISTRSTKSPTPKSQQPTKSSDISKDKQLLDTTLPASPNKTSTTEALKPKILARLDQSTATEESPGLGLGTDPVPSGTTNNLSTGPRISLALPIERSRSLGEKSVTELKEALSLIEAAVNGEGRPGNKKIRPKIYKTLQAMAEDLEQPKDRVAMKEELSNWMVLEDIKTSTQAKQSTECKDASVFDHNSSFYTNASDFSSWYNMRDNDFDEDETSSDPSIVHFFNFGLFSSGTESKRMKKQAKNGNEDDSFISEESSSQGKSIHSSSRGQSWWRKKNTDTPIMRGGGPDAVAENPPQKTSKNSLPPIPPYTSTVPKVDGWGAKPVQRELSMGEFSVESIGSSQFRRKGNKTYIMEVGPSQPGSTKNQKAVVAKYDGSPNHLAVI